MFISHRPRSCMAAFGDDNQLLHPTLSDGFPPKTWGRSRGAGGHFLPSSDAADRNPHCSVPQVETCVSRVFSEDVVPLAGLEGRAGSSLAKLRTKLRKRLNAGLSFSGDQMALNETTFVSPVNGRNTTSGNIAAVADSLLSV